MTSDVAAAVQALPTVSALARLLGRDLRPSAGFQVSDSPVTAVHVSELQDPTRFLAGGELLLTTGLALPSNGAACAAYVRRLAKVGVAALAIGLGPVHTSVPQELALECRQQGVLLLVVPAATPFLVISNAYWSMRARSSEQEIWDSLAAQQSIVEAGTSTDAQSAVLRRLAHSVDGWAARLDGSGAIEQILPAGLPIEASSLRKEIGRLGAVSVHSAASFVSGGRCVSAFPLAVAGRVVGYLAVGTSCQLSKGQRRLVHTAAALLSADAAHKHGQQSELEVVGRCVAILIDLGHIDAARELATANGLTPQGPEAAVLVLRTRRPDRVHRLIAEWCKSATAVRLSDDAWWYLLPAPVPDPDALEASVRHADEKLAAVMSRPIRLETLRTVRIQLTARLGELTAGQLELSDPLTRQAETLTPRLDRFLNDQSAPTIAALVAYLRHRGQWQQASRDLGIHRNTLRYRVGRARDVLGVDIDDPDNAARLWLMLRERAAT